MKQYAATLLLAGCILTGTACDRLLPQRETPMPELSEVQEYIAQSNMNAEVRLSGNVVELLVQQPADQLRRGGSLWARVGPYIYLFTPATRELMERFPALAGVRVITAVDDVEVARALLVSDALNDITWRRAHNIVGTALEHGTQRPSTMDRLVQFGEEVTQFQYNPDYVPPRQ